MTAQIDKITLNIDGKKIKLTLEQAKELKEILDETFGEKTVFVSSPSPIIIERPVYQLPYTWPHWDITWCGGTSVTTIDNTLLS